MTIQQFPKDSGTDITAGVGADSFISGTGERDPWGEACFACLLDNVINHERIRYALPTTEAVQADNIQTLPTMLKMFRQTRAVEPITKFNATDAPIPDRDALDKEFANFARWASRNKSG